MISIMFDVALLMVFLLVHILYTLVIIQTSTKLLGLLLLHTFNIFKKLYIYIISFMNFTIKKFFLSVVKTIKCIMQRCGFYFFNSEFRCKCVCIYIYLSFLVINKIWTQFNKLYFSVV